MSTPQQPRPHSDEGEGSISTERSPLLGRQQDTTDDNSAIVEPQNAQPEADENGQAPEEAEELSTKKLTAIMGTLWVGVFFAALGKWFGSILQSYLPCL